MKILALIFSLFLFLGCEKTSEKNNKVEREETKTEVVTVISTYEIIQQKEEFPDDFSKEYSYKFNYSEKEVSELNLDTTKISSNEYYHLTEQVFLNEEVEGIDFKIYYRFLYGYLSEKILRIERSDSIFEQLLSAKGGDGQESYELSTRFINDSIFEEKVIFKSTTIDEPFLVSEKMDIITTQYHYNEQFDFKKVSVDTTKIPSTALMDYPLELTSNFQLTEKDSINLLKFWRATAFNYINEEYEPLSNSKIQELINEAFNGKGGLWMGHIHQSPDQKFKLLTLKGESCGAYCNPFWESKLLLSNGEKIKAQQFTDVEDIYLMPDGKYLVLQQEYSRPASVFTASTVSAILFNLKNNSITYFPFEYEYSKYNDIANDSIFNPSGKLSLHQEHVINKEQWLKYDAKEKKLRYQYGTDLNYCCQIDSAYLYRGEFKYSEGKFKLLNETKEYIETTE